MLQLA